MSEDSLPSLPPADPQDPITPMVSVGVELHEMYLALGQAGFTKKEALFLVGQAVAAGVMLPVDDFGPDDFDEIEISLDEEDFDDDDEGDMLDGA